MEKQNLTTDPRPLGDIFATLAKGDSVLAKALEAILEAKTDTPTPLEDWLPGSVVEDLLNVSTRTLQSYRSSGLLPYALIGGKALYKRSDIEQLIESNYHRKEDRHDR